MQRIFKNNSFSQYSISSLNEAQQPIEKSFRHDALGYRREKTTVFMSHKHDDLDNIKGLIGFLEKKYDVKAYIDSWDPTMPSKTCGDTAKQLKNRIEMCDKFIFMATDGAIDSKWCNWELGYGDSQKFPDNIAIFHISDETGRRYKGHEYFDLYPYIAYYDGNEQYTDGNYVKPGYYWVVKKDEINTITPLGNWLYKR
jgi:hypothetical protein